MATTKRRPAAALIEQLLAEPWRFEFFQAVRLLEQHAVQRSAVQPGSAAALKPVAGGASPAAELIRFSASSHLQFAAGDVVSIQAMDPHPGDAHGQWLMRVQLMGLTGSTGVLPYHYSELLQQRGRARDPTLRNFLDLFNHRLIALYYQAWQKYRPAIARERHHNQGRRGQDPIGTALASLIGFGTEQVAARSPVPLDTLIGHGGYLARLVKSAAGLKSTLQRFLGLEVDIEQFRGEWYQLPEDLRSRFPDQGRGGMNHQLGTNLVLGSRSWQIQNRFRVRIQKLSYAELMTLAPDGPIMPALKALIQMAAGTEQDFDIALNVDTSDMPPLQLGGETGYRPLLGWNTCLQGRRPSRGQIDVVVSQFLA